MNEQDDNPLTRLGQDLLEAFLQDTDKADREFSDRIRSGELDKNDVYAEGLKIQSGNMLPEGNENRMLDFMDAIVGWVHPDYRL